jgi:hypothetical protein
VCWNSTPGSMTLLPQQRWCDCSCTKPPSLEAKAVYATEACVWALESWGPCGHMGRPYQPEPTIAVTLENSVCSKHPILAECSSSE